MRNKPDSTTWQLSCKDRLESGMIKLDFVEIAEARRKMKREMYNYVFRFINKNSWWEAYDKREIGTSELRVIRLIF